MGGACARARERVSKNAKRVCGRADDVPFFHHSLQVWQGFTVPYLVECGLPTKLEDFLAQFLLACGVLCQSPQREMDNRGGGFVPDEGKCCDVLDQLLGRHTAVLLLAFSGEHYAGSA